MQLDDLSKSSMWKREKGAETKLQELILHQERLPSSTNSIRRKIHSSTNLEGGIYLYITRI